MLEWYRSTDGEKRCHRGVLGRQGKVAVDVVRSRYALRLQTATSPPRSTVSVYPDCSHTPPPFHVHIYYTHPLVLYLYRFACVLWLTPHVYKSRPSVLGINHHIVSALENPRLILARSSTRISHTADLRLLLAFVLASFPNSVALLLHTLPSPVYVFPLGRLSYTHTQPFNVDQHLWSDDASQEKQDELEKGGGE